MFELVVVKRVFSFRFTLHLRLTAFRRCLLFWGKAQSLSTRLLGALFGMALDFRIVIFEFSVNIDIRTVESLVSRHLLRSGKQE